MSGSGYHEGVEEGDGNEHSLRVELCDHVGIVGEGDGGAGHFL